MKVTYELINWRTGKLVHKFQMSKDLKYKKSEYIGRFKILGINKLEFSNRIYYKFKVLDWRDIYNLIPVEYPWWYNQDLFNLAGLLVYVIALLTLTGLIKLIQIWLR